MTAPTNQNAVGATQPTDSPKPLRLATLAAQISALRFFIGHDQLAAMIDGAKGEEGAWFRAKISELYETVRTMPKSYETDGWGMRAIAHLRYFAGGRAVWLITERDAGAPGDSTPGEQSQAFGHADLFGDGGELGYISIAEIIANGGELDLFFTAKPLWQAWKLEKPQSARDALAMELHGVLYAALPDDGPEQDHIARMIAAVEAVA